MLLKSFSEKWQTKKVAENNPTTFRSFTKTPGLRPLRIINLPLNSPRGTY